MERLEKQKQEAKTEANQELVPKVESEKATKESKTNDEQSGGEDDEGEEAADVGEENNDEEEMVEVD